MSIRRNSTYNLLGLLVPLAASLVTIPIYLELIGGRQTALSLAAGPAIRRLPSAGAAAVVPRSRVMTPRLSETERAQHRAFIESLGESALWMKSGL